MNKAPQLASPGSTQSAAPASTPAREPRAFSFLKPRLVTVRVILMARADSSVPALVRAVVDHTIALHNEHGRESGYVQAIQVSVLNRRRRAARSWIQSILAGSVDAPTLHAIATQWLPTLAGNGRDAEFVTRTVRSCVEFVRGSITALLFDQPADNLLGNARALHVLETVLSVHLSAAEEARS